MPDYRLVAKADAEQSGGFVVRSPAVGIADGVPAEGVYLNPNEAFLTLAVLNRRYVVQLPRNVQGMVSEQCIADTHTPVGYGQPLFKLSEATELGVAGKKAKAGAGADTDTDVIPITAPSDGVFYRRPSPDVPAYVDEGSKVSKGTVLGLVEVMKSFNQITYGGPGLPDSGTVTRVLVEDAAEVAFGQTLFLIKAS